MPTQMCPICQGTGNITIHGDDNAVVTIPCPGQCAGSGQIEVPDSE